MYLHGYIINNAGPIANKFFGIVKSGSSITSPFSEKNFSITDLFSSKDLSGIGILRDGSGDANDDEDNLATVAGGAKEAPSLLKPGAYPKTAVAVERKKKMESFMVSCFGTVWYRTCLLVLKAFLV